MEKRLLQPGSGNMAYKLNLELLAVRSIPSIGCAGKEQKDANMAPAP